MLPSDWAEEMARLERKIKEAPNPVRRRQPRVTRMASPRQRRAESGPRDTTKAIYAESNRWNEAQVRSNEEGYWDNKELPDWSTGKATGTRSPGRKA
jgi:hypothetical protein